ncbi:substrate-binding domain-containing protein [Roseateles violae]|uniref:Substrate-binding domain-containing protein n=1 Tax=Roseateles violae TaxID=3058042 RepID=A0ABT8DWU0_9BURK|nr:substrate-binding domain-containing protein [Pelomonas sp. PFR6]MDN3921439.1 substrate-binding domain-containing protein [Pelomonas sp. PFR6]
MDDPSVALTVISSMATRQLLAELARTYRHIHGIEVRVESVGGVDAARRVQAGEAFDLVVLAGDAIAKLLAGGHLLAGSARAIADSAVAIAVRAGAPRPDVSSEDALRASLLAAPTIGYSTGPSGNALLALFERWGLAATLAPRLVQARPGLPVGSLLAGGEAEIGFQQLSELQALPGIALLGPMPPGLEIVTRFIGAIGAASTQPAAARALLDFLCAAEQGALKRRHGMDAPSD